TPLTASYSRAVSTSHSALPSAVEKARRCPSTEPEKTTPGIAVTAADCAGLQPGLALQAGGAAYQLRVPSSTRSAVRPPPSCGLRVKRAGSSGSAFVLGILTTSET